MQQASSCPAHGSGVQEDVQVEKQSSMSLQRGEGEGVGRSDVRSVFRFSAFNGVLPVA